ncbi:winged helix-turn-helix domain-containing protein [Pseudoneobacillus sp. C159]
MKNGFSKEYKEAVIKTTNQILNDDKRELHERDRLYHSPDGKTVMIPYGSTILTPACKATYKEKREREKEKLKREKELLEQQKRNKRLRGKHFIQVYVNRIVEMNQKKTLTMTQSGEFLDLLQSMQLDKDGLLIKGGKIMNFKDIQNILKKDKKETRVLLNRFIQEGLITEIKSGERKSNIYRINPQVAKMGKTENGHERFVKVYKKTYQELTKDLKKPQKGILLHMLPFFNVHYYVLCGTPLETEIEKIQPFNYKELAKHISVSENTLYSHIKAMRDAGIILEARGETKLIYIHPDLMLGLDDEENVEYTNNIRSLFEQQKQIAEKKDNWFDQYAHLAKLAQE